MIDSVIQRQVTLSLEEDVGSGDITAELIPAEKNAKARIISKENGIFCGKDWATEVFHQLNPEITIEWKKKDGDVLTPQCIIAELTGNARSLLTGERCAINWLQTLSGTATTAHQFAQQIKHTKTQILDTRKTIPGLRVAQKYAVKCGGGENHRMGLFDAYLIKENHIFSCGSIRNAIMTAKQNHPDKKIEVEVENLSELKEAIEEGADIIMLDNFELENMKEAVTINVGRAKLEVSGNVGLNQLSEIAATGVDYISIGALTKHIRAIDLSMRFL